MTRIALLLLLAIGGMGSAHAADPLSGPVKDCHPCRFSPGPGQPDIALTFVFAGKGDDRALTGLDLQPAGGAVQHLDTGGIAVSDFPDGFTIDTTDMNFDGFRDLSITTMMAANNSGARYWVYRPRSHDFTPLVLTGDGGGCADYSLAPADDHELLCHIHGSAVEHVDYSYRVVGDRAVAVRKEVQGEENGELVSTEFDLTVTPNKQIRRAVVGFVGDSSARTAFLGQLDAASARAAVAYRKGDKKGAVAALRPLFADKFPEALGSSEDKNFTAELNDFGFYLEEAGMPKDAIPILEAVLGIDSGRIVAYLNLADAYAATGDKANATKNYAEYRTRMTAVGKADKIPPRVAERLR